MPLERDSVIEHKDSYEEIYEASGIADDPRFYRWILRLLRPSAGWRLLDVACGEGGVLAAAQQLGVEPWGFDIAVNAVLKARALAPTARLAIGNAELLPFSSASFDCVTCLGSLENFSNPQRALSEIHRVLKDGGLLCAMMPNKFWLGDVLQVGAGREEQVPFQRVERVGTVQQWRRLLEGHGFSVKRLYGYVKTSPLVKQGKIRSLKKFALTHLLAMLSPASLAWSIIYVCERSSRGRGGNEADGAWLWRAEWV